MKRWNRILLFTVMGVWLVVMAANLLAPYRTFSEDENRYLAELPRYTVSGLIDGSSNRAMDNYINDHFFARHVWIMAQSTMELASGKRENNGVYYGKGMLFLGGAAEAAAFGAWALRAASQKWQNAGKQQCLKEEGDGHADYGCQNGGLLLWGAARCGRNFFAA